MVLGLRSKNRKGISVQVDYLIHVGEIKPWPPSESLKSVQSVLFQWENGDQSSGSFTSNVGIGKIPFNESFRLLTMLYKEGTGKSRARDRDGFQKNCLEFYLYEHRKDKGVKGQLLGSCVINLADYGIIKEAVSISVLLSCKRSFRTTAQPLLFVKIQPLDKDSSASSPNSSLSKEVSLDKDGSQSVSESLSEENDEEVEIASFSGDDDDDDVSSHSSRVISSSAFEATGSSQPQKKENEAESAKKGTRRGNGEPALWSGVAATKPEVNAVAESLEHPNGNLSLLSSINLSSNIGNSVSYSRSLPKSPEKSLLPILRESISNCVNSSSSSLHYLDKIDVSGTCTRSSEKESTFNGFHIKDADGNVKMQGNAKPPFRDNIVDSFSAKVASSDSYFQVDVNPDHGSVTNSQSNKEHYKEETIIITDSHVSLPKYEQKKERLENGQRERILEEENNSANNKQSRKLSQDDTKNEVTPQTDDTLTFERRSLRVQENNTNGDKLKHVMPVQLLHDSVKSNGLFRNSQFLERTKVVDMQRDGHNNATSYAKNKRKETVNEFSDGKVELESKIEMLEEELREAAAVEVSLYSVVAEHGSSINKVHAPARRLSRFYLHACKAKSQAKRASAARAAVSGLALVSKACGNDVPRLTFWLSNSIVLRAIVSRSIGEMSLSTGPCISFYGGQKETNDRFHLQSSEFSSEKEKKDSGGTFDDWEDAQTFTVALEKIETWIFSRIVESVWWQTLTPHMQSAAAKGSNSRNTNERRCGLGDQKQGNFSIDLWKKAFKDACERLCPIRAGGHECGCLPVLARLVMEQLVDRLDVAMFNAVLRESADEMPTDPVSDPISDSKVLPIPAGKSSFGAGAQLKNAIGNWSRWLTDLFGIDDTDSPGDENVDKRLEVDTSFKAFQLLNQLSDLMMLPLEMLADKSTRKEVCPTFGAPLIKKVLYNFVPDEFCPDPVPMSILDALDSEDSFEAAEESITSIPLDATPIVYSPPQTAFLAGVIGEVGSQPLSRSGSSVLKKSYTSDDELDELDSPMNSIIASTNPNWTPRAKGGRNVVRYKLLREVWRDGK